jgi:hypothetical protein
VYYCEHKKQTFKHRRLPYRPEKNVRDNSDDKVMISKLFRTSKPHFSEKKTVFFNVMERRPIIK